MATPDRERNNARKAAAREYQSKNPGMRYKAALNQVSTDAAPRRTESHHRDALSTLLGISSVKDVLARYQAPSERWIRPGDRWYGYDGGVPLGHTDNGELVSINIGPGRADYGDGPHGAIAGDSAHETATLIATALRAKNAPQNLQVIYADPSNSNGVPIGMADTEFRNTDAPDAFPAWLDNELQHRFEAAATAGARDIAHLRALAGEDSEVQAIPRVLVVATASPGNDVYPSHPQRWNEALISLTQIGRAADMFLLLLCPHSAPPTLLREIWTNICYRIALKGTSSSLFDDLLTNAADGTAVLSVSGSPGQSFTALPLDTKLIDTVNQARDELTHD